MGKYSIDEEKVIDGVRTVFSYKRTILRMKGDLSSKTEYYNEGTIRTTYYEGGIDIFNYNEYNKKWYISSYEKHGIQKHFTKTHPGGIGPHHKDYRVENVIYYLNYLGNFKENLLHGEYFEYFHDKKIFRQFNFKDGIQHGICKEFYSNGNLKCECHYNNGIPHGNHHEFHKNGKLSTECEWVKGKPTGKDVHYCSNGYITKIVTFKNGFDSIKVETFHKKSNQLESLTNYNNGSNSENYHESFIGPFSDSSWGIYVDNCFNYDFGKPHGHSVHYTINGEVIEEGDYEYGKKKGVWLINEELKNNEDED